MNRLLIKWIQKDVPTFLFTVHDFRRGMLNRKLEGCDSEYASSFDPPEAPQPDSVTRQILQTTYGIDKLDDEILKMGNKLVTVSHPFNGLRSSYYEDVDINMYIECLTIWKMVKPRQVMVLLKKGFSLTLIEDKRNWRNSVKDFASMRLNFD